jgi:hypothetical protein
MYLHIGKDRIIKNEDVLFLLDYDTIKENALFKDFYETIKDENKIDISQDNPKTIIITKENESVKAYITNIASTTLSNRKILK